MHSAALLACCCCCMCAGVTIVVGCAMLSLALGVMSGSPALLATLAGSLVLGVLYSIGKLQGRTAAACWCQQKYYYLVSNQTAGCYLGLGLLGVGCMLTDPQPLHLRIAASSPANALRPRLRLLAHGCYQKVQPCLYGSQCRQDCPLACSDLLPCTYSHSDPPVCLPFRVPICLPTHPLTPPPELPLMRWKRSPWLAALCILAVRAVMVQLGFFLHMQHSLGISGFVLTRPLAFTMGFMLLYSVVIALFKDLPDIKGDTQAGVRTFSVRHGAKAIYWTCIGLLMAAYAGGVVFAATSPEPWARLPVALGHMALAGLLYSKSVKVNPDRKQDLASHYMFVWKLFYAEYFIIPFLR